MTRSISTRLARGAFGVFTFVEVRLPAGGGGFVGGADHVDQRHQAIVVPLANLDKLFLVLLAYDRREQGLFRAVTALADAGAITIDQARQQRLVQARDEVMLEHRPIFSSSRKGSIPGKGLGIVVFSPLVRQRCKI